MLRLAWAYQGGGGAATYIAGGAAIDIAMTDRNIDIAPAAGLDIQTGGAAIDATNSERSLDIENDGHSVDL